MASPFRGMEPLRRAEKPGKSRTTRTKLAAIVFALFHDVLRHECALRGHRFAIETRNRLIWREWRYVTDDVATRVLLVVDTVTEKVLADASRQASLRQIGLVGLVEELLRAVKAK